MFIFQILQILVRHGPVLTSHIYVKYTSHSCTGVVLFNSLGRNHRISNGPSKGGDGGRSPKALVFIKVLKAY